MRMRIDRDVTTPVSPVINFLALIREESQIGIGGSPESALEACERIERLCTDFLIPIEQGRPERRIEADLDEIRAARDDWPDDWKALVEEEL